MSLTIPESIRGQVLAQGKNAYLVRGQYAIGHMLDESRMEAWFWYDIYNRSHSSGGFRSITAAFENLAKYLGQE